MEDKNGARLYKWKAGCASVAIRWMDRTPQVDYATRGGGGRAMPRTRSNGAGVIHWMWLIFV